ncbi:hypothetical protein ACJX0J_038918 [Zea mays]
MAGKKGNVHDSKEIKWHNMEMAGKENISIKEGTHNFEISVAILEITMRLRVTKTTEGHVCTNSRLHNTGLFVSTAHFILFLAYHIIVIIRFRYIMANVKVVIYVDVYGGCYLDDTYVMFFCNRFSCLFTHALGFFSTSTTACKLMATQILTVVVAMRLAVGILFFLDKAYSTD